MREREDCLKPPEMKVEDWTEAHKKTCQLFVKEKLRYSQLSLEFSCVKYIHRDIGVLEKVDIVRSNGSPFDRTKTGVLSCCELDDFSMLLRCVGFLN